MQAEAEAAVQPDRLLDGLGRKAEAMAWGGRHHHAIRREIKGAQGRIRCEDAGGLRLSIAVATLRIGGNASVGMRYVRGETDVPLVGCWVRGKMAALLLAAARATGIAVFRGDRLASGLAAKLQPGAKVPAALFGQVAQALYAFRAIR